jgi:hypothetical protein
MDRMLVLSLDRPRRIDRVIEYFGNLLAPIIISGARDTR